jgi:cytoskeleton protein RodZ
MADNDESEAEGQETDSAPDLGSKLKDAREAQDLSLEEIAAELRIGAHHLNALEECRFDEIGAPVFAKGYLKQYAARLGLDVAELVEDYERSARAQSVEITPSRTITVRDERQIKIWVGAGGALVLMAAILWTWWWLGSVEDPEQLPVESVVDMAEPLDLPPVAPEPVPALVPVSDPQVEPEPLLTVDSAIVNQTELPEPAVSDDEAEPEDLSATTDAAPADASVFNGPALEIFFVAESWAEVTAEDGERLYYDLGREGTRARVPADRGLNLFFGNAAGVELSIDGRAISIPASARRGNLAQFDLDALVDIAGIIDAND